MRSEIEIQWQLTVLDCATFVFTYSFSGAMITCRVIWMSVLGKLLIKMIWRSVAWSRASRCRSLVPTCEFDVRIHRVQ